MSLYSEFLADAKEMIADFGVAGSANAGAITFKCLISDPAVSTVLEAVMLHLAKAIARDGEGATKLVEIRVTGAPSDADARAVAKTIAESPLVKTALFGKSDQCGAAPGVELPGACEPTM